MGDMKHTPGPWRDDGYRIYAPPDEAGEERMIVEYKHVADFHRPDARLIAAAPDLFAACEVIASLIRKYDPTRSTYVIHTGNLIEAAELSRNAIAKATGEDGRS